MTTTQAPKSPLGSDAIKVTQSMKEWIGRLSKPGFYLTTCQSRPIGSEQWKAHRCYFPTGPNRVLAKRSPVGSMVERMEQAGLITWQEERVERDRRREVRFLRSVLTSKGKAIRQAAAAAEKANSLTPKP